MSMKVNAGTQTIRPTITMQIKSESMHHVMDPDFTFDKTTAEKTGGLAQRLLVPVVCTFAPVFRVLKKVAEFVKAAFFGLVAVMKVLGNKIKEGVVSLKEKIEERKNTSIFAKVVKERLVEDNDFPMHETVKSFEDNTELDQQSIASLLKTVKSTGSMPNADAIDKLLDSAVESLSSPKRRSIKLDNKDNRQELLQDIILRDSQIKEIKKNVLDDIRNNYENMVPTDDKSILTIIANNTPKGITLSEAEKTDIVEFFYD